MTDRCVAACLKAQTQSGAGEGRGGSRPARATVSFGSTAMALNALNRRLGGALQVTFRSFSSVSLRSGGIRQCTSAACRSPIFLALTQPSHCFTPHDVICTVRKARFQPELGVQYSLCSSSLYSLFDSMVLLVFRQSVSCHTIDILKRCQYGDRRSPDGSNVFLRH